MRRLESRPIDVQPPAKRAEPVGVNGISIVIVDDLTLFREGLRMLLSAEPDLEVVGQAGDPDAGLTLLREREPDVLLLDLEMSHRQIVHSVPGFLRASPRTRIVVLSRYDDPQLASELIGLGVRAYLVKTASRAELVSVIRAVTADEGRVVVSMSHRGFRSGEEHPVLTRRQKEVLTLAAQALSNAQIADRLVISENTVKRHLNRIYSQLGAVSRVDAINKARAAVLIPPIDPG